MRKIRVQLPGVTRLTPPQTIRPGPRSVQVAPSAHKQAAQRHARAVYLQSAVSHAMPPANLSYMEADERAAIAAWYRDATGG